MISEGNCKNLMRIIRSYNVCFICWYSLSILILDQVEQLITTNGGLEEQLLAIQRERDDLMRRKHVEPDNDTNELKEKYDKEVQLIDFSVIL